MCDIFSFLFGAVFGMACDQGHTNFKNELGSIPSLYALQKFIEHDKYLFCNILILA